MSVHHHREKGAAMREIARYTRTLPVSLERMFENALDWAHLPHLHRTTFSDGELLDAADDFWEARLWLRGYGGLSQVVRLTLDPTTGVWISEVRGGVSKGLLIHTTATASAERTLNFDVRFRVPSWRPWNGWLGRKMIETYAQLYDEDESMMVERQTGLDARRARDAALVRLGTDADLKAPGFTFDKGGRRFAVARIDDRWVAYSTLCPHMLGPLTGPVVDGCVECPWHGYRFDVRSRACEGRPLKLMKAPTLERDADGVFWA